jgi:uncharacterized protein (UPF0262 family)
MTRAPRLVDVALDERSVVRRSPDIEHERKVAIYDLIEANHFAPAVEHPGPFRLRLSIEETRLVFDIRDEADADLHRVPLALQPFRSVIKDYFRVCESYFEAIRTATPSRIEAIDMGRRGLHDEGAEILRRELEGRIGLDRDTARRLFTLICVLHVRG